LTVKKILQTYLEPLMNEGYIDKQESNINHRNNIYYPLVLDSENSFPCSRFFQAKKGIWNKKMASQNSPILRTN
jgi:hypothetical protein